ncbi:gamma-aminobutyric acid type B receptor subunit 1-like isoform X2 [Symsagittifera roscoffensis]|uniref:gamma-aminobutyric acid type B receptor subunit 1-like isoform X2 n=1 Tax=Symsagittifera roscoffensis TaxID=84072 RepID=UPI00307C5DDA
MHQCFSRDVFDFDDNCKLTRTERLSLIICFTSMVVDDFRSDNEKYINTYLSRSSLKKRDSHLVTMASLNVFVHALFVLLTQVSLAEYSKDDILPDKCENFSSGTKFINIGAMFPLNGSWDGGVSCFPAAQLALAHVNCHPSRSLVDGYKLKLQVTNTYCEPGKGVKDLYDFLYESSPDTPSAILGPGCSSVSTAVAEAAHLWNVLMVSYGSSSPALSDRDRFPTFFRTHPSALIHNPTRLNLFSQFGWKKAFVLVHLQEVFTTTADDLTQQGKKHGIAVKRSTFQTNPKNAIESLKAQDARVIVGLFYETVARQVFCEAYKAGLYGPKIVWFILGWFPDNWFHPRKNEHLSCTLEQMRAATEGHFTTEIMQLGSEDSPTFSGIKPLHFQSKLLDKLDKAGKNSGGFPESPLAYDAVWALAIAINKTIVELKNEGKSVEEEFKAIRDVTVLSKDAFSLLKRNLDRTNFMGVSGNVSFFAGDRVSSVAIEFMSNGSYLDYGSHTENYDVSMVQNDHDFWPFSVKYQAPRDQIEMRSELDRLKPPVLFTFSIFAFLGMLISIALLIFNNSSFRNASIIYNSQPAMNSVMLLGCVVTLFCVFLNGLTDELDSSIRTDTLCQGVLWLMSLGFTLGFGALFAKVWALHVVAAKMKPSRMKALAKSRASHGGSSNGLTSPTLIRSKAKMTLAQRASVMSERGDPPSGQSSVGGASTFGGHELPKDVKVSSTHMYACLSLLFLLDLAFLSLYSYLAPLSLQNEFLPMRNVTADGEVRVRPYIRHCRSTDHNTWTGLNFGIKGFLLLLGALFAYDSRNVHLDNMNDSRQVAMSVYNIVTLFWTTVPVTMLIKAHQDASYIFSALATILSVFVTQGFIFGPKLRALIDGSRNPNVIEDVAKESSVKHLAVAGVERNGSGSLPMKRESTKRRKAANRKRANELELYHDLNEENERIKEEIAELDAYLIRLRDKYEELSKERLENTLRKRVPPGRVPIEDVDFFTEFLYIDAEDVDQMNVTEL